MLGWAQRGGTNGPDMIEFYDREGRPIAFCDDGRSLFLWDGRPAAFIVEDRVFAYCGRFMGWFEDGWICDADGGRVLFEFDAVGGPAKPERGPRVEKGQRGAKSSRGARQATPAHPAPSSSWSDRSFASLI